VPSGGGWTGSQLLCKWVAGRVLETVESEKRTIRVEKDAIKAVVKDERRVGLERLDVDAVPVSGCVSKNLLLLQPYE